MKSFVKASLVLHFLLLMTLSVCQHIFQKEQNYYNAAVDLTEYETKMPGIRIPIYVRVNCIPTINVHECMNIYIYTCTCTYT